MPDIVLSPDAAVPEPLDASTKSTFARTLRLDGNQPLCKALVYVFHRTRQMQLLEGEPLPIVDATTRTVAFELQPEDLIYPGLFEVHVVAENEDDTIQRYPGAEALRINVTGETRRYELGMLTRAVEETFRYRQEAETFAKAQANGTVVQLSSLPTASEHNGEVWFVINTRQYYKSDGASWESAGTATAGITSEGELTDVPVARVDTISNLKSNLTPTPNIHRIVEGYQSAGDRGGGLLRWVPGDTRTADNGLVFESAVSGYGPGEANEGRWHRITEGALSAKAFGATGDGTGDDTTAIQAAIDAAAAGEYRAVLLPKGDYPVTQLALKCGVVLFGEGWHTNILATEDTTPLVAASADTVSQAVIRDLRVSGYGDAGSSSNCIDIQDASSVLIENVFVINGSSNNIRVRNCEEVFVVGCRSQWPKGDNHSNINIQLSTKCRVHQCIVRDGKWLGVQFEDADDCAITDCDIGGPNLSHSGINCWGTVNRLLIQGNLVWPENGGSGMAIAPSNETRGVHVIGNMVRNTRVHGIDIEDSREAVVVGNYLFNCSVNGQGGDIQIENAIDVLVANNYVVDGGRDGIVVTADETNNYSANNRVSITGNFITRVRKGINIGATIEDSLITNNLVRECSREGIVLGVGCNQIVVAQNSLTNCSQETDAGSDAMVLRGNNHVVVQNSIVSTKAPRHNRGITLTSISDHCQIKYNHIEGQAGDAINDNGNFNTVNGTGEEATDAETPTASNWRHGNIVDFTDTDDGSGDGVYLLKKDGTWTQLA